MNQSIKPAVVPPRPGLEREEPELAQEDDIPVDDNGPAAQDPSGDDALRQVEHE
jgi:hypothetical protein